MRIEFTVDGLPPMKRGEKSMWARNDQALRVAELRQKALAAREAAGLERCLDCCVALELTVHVPPRQLESVGDLDNFVTGVCDALHAADRQALPYVHTIFARPENAAIQPRLPIILANDSKVLRITATKEATSQDSDTWYQVAVEPLA